MHKEYSDEEIRSLAYRRWGITIKRVGVSAGNVEFAGPCPLSCRCGKDRFRVWSSGNFWCRKCGEKGWLDDDKKDWKPDPDLTEAYQRQIVLLEGERQKHLRAWIEGYKSGYYRGWHDAMTLQQRQYWLEEGIPSWAIDYYGMGYCQEKKFKGQDGEDCSAPAYTIPIRNPDSWEVINIQYRLVDPPPGVGKYRQEYDLPAASFYTRRGLMEGKAIVVEGAKKAIVVLECIEKVCQVVGWPGISPSPRLIQELSGFSGGLWIMLDPGENNEQATERAARILHPVPVRWVNVPIKPDDAIVKYGFRKEDLQKSFKQARRL